MPQAQPLGQRIPRPQKLGRAPHMTLASVNLKTRSAPQTWIQRQHLSRTKFHGVWGSRAQVNSQHGPGGPRTRAGDAAASRQASAGALPGRGPAGWKEVLGDHSPARHPPRPQPPAPPHPPRRAPGRSGSVTVSTSRKSSRKAPLSALGTIYPPFIVPGADA